MTSNAKVATFTAVAILLLGATNGFAVCVLPIYVQGSITTSLSTTRGEARGDGIASIRNFQGEICTQYPVNATGTLREDLSTVIATDATTGLGEINTNPFAPARVGHCYTSSITVQSGYLNDAKTGSEVCWVGPPKPPTKIVCNDPDASTACEPTGPICSNTGNPEEYCPVSPLVVDVAGRGYHLTGVAEGVEFDLNADGHVDRVAWTRAGEGLAFVALDLDSNGHIDSGAELFGDATRTTSGTAANGFVALAQYDDNRDGVIDAGDAIWPHLILWIDRNHDGWSDLDELSSIQSSAISGLGLDYRWSGRRDGSGNYLRYAASAVISGQPRKFYDVFFSRLP